MRDLKGSEELMVRSHDEMVEEWLLIRPCNSIVLYIYATSLETPYMLRAGDSLAPPSYAG